MTDDEFAKINRGNGVANDNLATLGDIMLATLKKVRELDGKIEDTKNEIVELRKETAGVKTTIQHIDNANAPMAKRSFWLLVASVLIASIGIVLAYLGLKH